MRKVVDTVLDLRISFASAILHVRKQLVISPDALAVEKFRANGNNIKLLVPHKITNQRIFVTDNCTYNDSLFIDGEIPTKFALAFFKSANAVGSWTNSQ